MDPIVRFENVTKRYNLGLTRISFPVMISQSLRNMIKNNHSPRKNHLLALKDINFKLYKGESLAFVGPNGAGKSTILKLLAKITRPTQGRIDVNGQLSALIELGAGFHPDLTGRENIYLNGTILGLKRKEVDMRFDEIVSFAELERFIDTPVKRYSSGMTVRLGFAVASCIEPDILLVDEVLAVGDASFREKCVKRINELIKRGTSLIFVSHSMELVKSVCEKAIYLEHGEIQKYGKSSDVIDAYHNALDHQRALQYSQSNGEKPITGLDIEITKIEVKGQNQPHQEFIKSDEKIEIFIHYLAYKPLGKSNVVVRIYRADGLSCCVMRTYYDGFKLNIEKGSGTISLIIEPVQLYGGMYHCTAWIMNENDIMGISSGASGWFTVKNLESGRKIQDAVFEPNRKWGHQINEFG